MNIDRLWPLMMAGMGGVLVAHGIWFIGYPLLFGSVFLQGRIR